MNISRQYSSPARDEAARATERRILLSAEQHFLEIGYPSTTVAMIAARAGVSKQTVYNSCGSKAELLKRLYDVRLVGDDQPVPLGDRPEARHIAALDDPCAVIDAYVSLGVTLLQRLGPLLSVIVTGAAAGEQDLIDLTATMDAERLIGCTGIVRRLADLDGLKDAMTVDRARDIVWTMNGVPGWDMLVRRRGWSLDEYREWLAQALKDMLLRTA